ncbi:TPA: phage major tail tube protein [Stenotrophomonas maltophilia]|jgi:P2 family phage contractile tail tube protein|uniref:Major tail tube protein n=2 Tax=Stenotrophomonas maltophilia TaxID=40324 RepID=B2FRA3_STRMK|nr:MULTISPECIES: phage major tail tube protein [Stenotrophomonas]EJE6496963.1 phage major tail tube protein [Salmonella enterica]MCV4210508.1 phage major tail tube protein [Pseudomonas cichorii]AGQ48850.1 tail tube protein [Stenotrophomonas maltophilia]ASE52963.1 phage major tail tube protein [Stenotrophomonas maltophilia]EKT4074947.1 phage major tail tube protein [Stenotrophomonas maltophilia]
MTRKIRKNFNFYVDGKGYAGSVMSFTAPKLSLKTEDFQAGGMLAPTEIVLGHEKLTADVEFASDDAEIMSKFHVIESKEYGFTAREALEGDDGEVTQVVHNMRGKVKLLDRGETKVGEKGTIKVSLALSYYKLTHGAQVVQEIDVVNMIARQGGIDVLAGIRGALGI